MANVILPPDWQLPESELTDERAWLNRRSFLKGLGVATGASTLNIGCAQAMDLGPRSPIPESYTYALPSFKRNPRYGGGGKVTPELTDEKSAASYNNFYEFTTDKGRVWRLAPKMEIRPWTLKVHGLCDKPTTFDMDDLLKSMPIEERIHRFRCVEAWSMVVPWIGFPLKALLEAVQPFGDAKFVRLVTKKDVDGMPGILQQPWYDWPYHEGLTIEEATHELALMAVGIYGHPLPNQHGAPIRLVTPWKYGYKNIKSIVEIELVRERPKTFWNELQAAEYDFWGNVRPDIPHPRWSQASERVVPTGERVPTLMFNGYAEQVAGLYSGLSGPLDKALRTP